MAILKVKDIRKMSSEERLAKLRELKAELLRLRVQQASGAPLENPGKIRVIKKTIARILTVINEERKSSKRA
ncbi:MAG: 50S ribosomal protein L29 [Candidatus Verstraetearchaeota archaeon]|nr:50S ribosomal protein L29 [Candidatus Verstraetearchaeota archaeon]